MPIIIMLVLMAGMMFWTNRQQKKQAQERQDKLNSLKAGDEVVTIGGLYGVVDNLDLSEQKVVLDIEGIYLTFELSAVKTIVEAKQAVISTPTEN